MLENEYELASLQVLAETEEKISKKKAVALFDDGTLNALEAGKFASLQTIHRVLFEDIYDFAGKIRTVYNGPLVKTTLEEIIVNTF